MSSAYTICIGSKLYMAGVEVAQTVDLNSPESELAKIKITNNSSGNFSQEYVPGLFDPGDMNFDVIFTPAQHHALYVAFAARTVGPWTEVYPDGSGWTFSGFITKIADEGKTENEVIRGKITVSLTTVALFVQSGLS